MARVCSMYFMTEWEGLTEKIFGLRSWYTNCTDQMQQVQSTFMQSNWLQREENGNSGEEGVLHVHEIPSVVGVWRFSGTAQYAFYHMNIGNWSNSALDNLPFTLRMFTFISYFDQPIYSNKIVSVINFHQFCRAICISSKAIHIFLALSLWHLHLSNEKFFLTFSQGNRQYAGLMVHIKTSTFQAFHFIFR